MLYFFFFFGIKYIFFFYSFIKILIVIWGFFNRPKYIISRLLSIICKAFIESIFYLKGVIIKFEMIFKLNCVYFQIEFIKNICAIIYLINIYFFNNIYFLLQIFLNRNNLIILIAISCKIITKVQITMCIFHTKYFS